MITSELLEVGEALRAAEFADSIWGLVTPNQAERIRVSSPDSDIGAVTFIAEMEQGTAAGEVWSRDQVLDRVFAGIIDGTLTTEDAIIIGEHVGYNR